MLLLGIYLISFMVVWYAYLHKLPPIGVYNVVYTILNIQFCIQYGAYYMVFHVISLCVHTISLCVEQKLYDISCNFIMCRIRDFALFLVKICRIIQKYPPFCRKDFSQKTFPYFVYNTQKYLQWDFFRPTPYYLVPQIPTIIL